MRQAHRISHALLLVALPALLLACGGSNEPSSSPYAGSYVATSWTTTGTSGQQHPLVNGSTLQIALAENGTTSGHLHFAASGATPALDADMVGTWRANGTTIDFTQAADSFVRDMLFTAGSDVQGATILTASQTFSGTVIDITLTRVAVP